MITTAWLAVNLPRRRVDQQTARHLTFLAREPIRASQRTVRELLATLRSEPGPKVCLGETMWGEPVLIPLAFLVRAFGLIHGGTGSGKSMTGCAVMEAIIERLPQLRSVGFGVLDAKGELFDRALYLLARRLERLEGEAREELLRRIDRKSVV